MSRVEDCLFSFRSLMQKQKEPFFSEANGTGTSFLVVASSSDPSPSIRSTWPVVKFLVVGLNWFRMDWIGRTLRFERSRRFYDTFIGPLPPSYMLPGSVGISKTSGRGCSRFAANLTSYCISFLIMVSNSSLKARMFGYLFQTVGYGHLEHSIYPYIT